MLIYSLFSNPAFFCTIVVIIAISISLHELGHGIAAISQGDKTPIYTGHMTLNPVVHLGIPSIVFLLLTGMAWGQMPVNPRNFRDSKWSNIIVSAAGPLTNFALGFGGILVIKILFNLSFASSGMIEFFYYVAYLNFALGMFNLFPLPPLDGFHIASEFFPQMKLLANSQAGLALFMILFVSGAGRIFFDLAEKLVLLSTGF